MGNNPFIMTYTRIVENKTDSELINDFKVNFERSNCDRLIIENEKKIVVENGYFRFTSNWNIWNGVSTAELTINDIENEKKKTIELKVDYSRGIIGSIFSTILISVFILTFFGPTLLDFTLVTILASYVGIYIFVLLPKYSSLKKLFNKTIDKGVDGDNLGNYNWLKILEGKTDKELIEIAQGKADLPETVKRMAFEELGRRKK